MNLSEKNNCLLTTVFWHLNFHEWEFENCFIEEKSELMPKDIKPGNPY